MRQVESRTILIVEDDQAIREALAGALEDEGYKAFGMSNGSEAVEWLRTCELCPSLIIVDLMMPVMDGRALCAELKSDPELAAIPLVIMSADDRLAERSGELEADAYLKKPLDMPKLLSTIDERRL